MNSDHTLVAVFDAAHVRFFDYKEAHGKLEGVLANVSSGLHHHVHDIETDRQAVQIRAAPASCF